MEADLSRFHNGTDLRDRWRCGPDGKRLLTLRMIYVRVKHLPPEAAVPRAVGGAGWNVGDYLLADLYHGTTGQAHPARPQESGPKAPDPARAKKVAAARARARERERAIETGEIT